MVGLGSVWSGFCAGASRRGPSKIAPKPGVLQHLRNVWEHRRGDKAGKGDRATTALRDRWGELLPTQTLNKLPKSCTNPMTIQSKRSVWGSVSWSVWGSVWGRGQVWPHPRSWAPAAVPWISAKPPGVVFLLHFGSIFCAPRAQFSLCPRPQKFGKKIQFWPEFFGKRAPLFGAILRPAGPVLGPFFKFIFEPVFLFSYLENKKKT